MCCGEARDGGAREEAGGRLLRGGARTRAVPAGGGRAWLLGVAGAVSSRGDDANNGRVGATRAARRPTSRAPRPPLPPMSVLPPTRPPPPQCRPHGNAAPAVAQFGLLFLFWSAIGSAFDFLFPPATPDVFDAAFSTPAAPPMTFGGGGGGGGGGGLLGGGDSLEVGEREGASASDRAVHAALSSRHT